MCIRDNRYDGCMRVPTHCARVFLELCLCCGQSQIPLHRRRLSSYLSGGCAVGGSKVWCPPTMHMYNPALWVGLGHAVCSRGTRILFHNFIFHTFIVTWLVVALIIFFPPAVFRLPSLKVAEFSSAQLINFRLPTHEAQQGFLKRIGVPSLPRRYLSYSASTPPGAAHTEEESVANVKHTRTFFFFF